MIHTRSVQIMSVLIYRNFTIFSKNIRSIFINALCLTTTEVVLFGYLFPLLGMPSTLIGPIFLSSSSMLMLVFGYSTALQWSVDQEKIRLIDYYLTLPIAKKWLFCSYVINFILESSAVIIPVIFIGLFFLPAISIKFYLLPLLFLFYMASISFYALFFLACAFSFNRKWFQAHLWPRILSPMYCLSATLFLWHHVYEFWPNLGIFFLLNPVTYVVEGSRALLISPEKFISLPICFAALLLFCGIMVLLCKRGIKKTLDPV